MSLKQRILFEICFICICIACLLPVVNGLAATTGVVKNGSRSFTYVNKVTVKNPSSQTINSVKIEVPLPSQNQGDWQEFLGEEFYPQPKEIVVNADGTRKAVYQLSNLAAGSSQMLEHRYSFTNYAISYNNDFAKTGGKQEQQALPASYLQPEKYIESDNPAIITYAQGLKGDEQNPYSIARKMFSDINLFMTYENLPAAEHSAMLALQTGKGNCLDYTYLYIACLRAVGIPARMYNGFVYSPAENNQQPYLGTDGLLRADRLKHSWVEFYVDGIGWVVADPTYTYTVNIGDKPQKMVDWSRFAGITKEHRLLTWNEGPEQDINYKYAGAQPKIEYDSRIVMDAIVLPYNDIANHWAKDSIMNLRYWSTPIVLGLSDTEFGVEEEITRAQLVAMINRALDYVEPLAEDKISNFELKDVPANHWARQEIMKAINRGFISGYPDGAFRPEQKVTRAELAAILCSAGNINAEGETPFTDLDQPGFSWAERSISRLYQAGLATGVTTTQYMPQKTLTRGEAAVFIDRWLNSDYFEMP